MPIRTLEFPVVLEPWQQERIKFYFEKLKIIWNIGLARLNDFDTFTGHYNKDTKGYNPCCPINWEYRRYWLEKDGTIIDKPAQSQKSVCDRMEAPFSKIISEQSKHLLKEFHQVKTVIPASRGKGKTTAEWLASDKCVVVTTSRLLNLTGVQAVDNCSGFSCPLPQDYNAPLLSRYEFNASGGLGLVIKADNLKYREDKEELLSIPYKFRFGTIKALSTSWQEYDKSRRRASTNGIFRGKPKFKNSRDKVETVVHPNPKGVIVPDGKDTLKGVPELGKISVPGLDKRWLNPDGSRPEIATFKICQSPSGWYVQLTGELDRSQKLRDCNKAIAGDPGLLNYITFDDGKHIENPRFWRKQEEKLDKLQRELAHKRSHNLILWLNHRERTIDDIRSIVNINTDDAQALLHAKSEQEGKAIINQSRWSRLIFKRGEESKAIQQLVKRIKHQHECIRRIRRSFAHRLSSWLVRNHTIFVCEDGLQKEQLRHRAGIKLDENDVAQKNNSRAKSGLTKSLSDAAHGQLMELCAQKFKEAGRTFIRYPARNTTLECPICGTDNQMESNHAGQRYHCSHCGWHEAGRDQKPGILMLMRLMQTADVKLLISGERYKDKTALHSLIKQHQGLITLEMVSNEVRDAIIYQQNWLATTGGRVKARRSCAKEYNV
jgi:putative transposase